MTLEIHTLMHKNVRLLPAQVKLRTILYGFDTHTLLAHKLMDCTYP